VPPAAPPQPVTRPNVSFMRGGLKPIVPAAPQEPQSSVLVRHARPVETPVEPQAPRFLPVVETIEVSAPPEAKQFHEPLAPVGRLTEDQRRALQSALFELSECRRMIEAVSASRVR